MWIKDGELIEERNDEKIRELEKQREALVDELFKKEGPNCFRRMNIITAPFNKKIGKLSREQKMERPIHLTRPVSESCGDRMSIEDFKANVECGGFIDYDGFGTYIMDEKLSNIDISPSDVKAGMVRPEFEEIMWFNK